MDTAGFDATVLLAAVDAGHLPSDTRVFGAHLTYFFEQGCTFFFLAAVCVFMAGAIIVLGVLSVTGMLLITPSAGTSRDFSVPDAWPWVTFGAVCLLLFMVVAVICGSRVVDAVRGLGSWRTQVLVLAPDGFVARTGTSPHAVFAVSYAVFAVSYAALAAISLSIQHARYETITNLLLTYQYPLPDATETIQRKLVIWRVDPRFGPSAPIAQAILEAHTRAMAARSTGK